MVERADADCNVDAAGNLPSMSIGGRRDRAYSEEGMVGFRWRFDSAGWSCELSCELAALDVNR